MAMHPLPDHPQMIYLAEWKAIGESLFGPDKRAWKFVCPHCRAESTVQDAVDHFGALSNPAVGTRCPKCEARCAPREKYGPETCYRVLFMPGDAPGFEIPPQGQCVYTMPFWAPDRPETAAEAAVREVIEAVGDSTPRETAPAPAAKPAPKKGAPSGYGFKF